MHIHCKIKDCLRRADSYKLRPCFKPELLRILKNYESSFEIGDYYCNRCHIRAKRAYDIQNHVNNQSIIKIIIDKKF